MMGEAEFHWLVLKGLLRYHQEGIPDLGKSRIPDLEKSRIPDMEKSGIPT